MKRLGKGSLSLFALFLFMGLFAACSSSEESSGSQSCAEQCASEPEGTQDECIIACEA